MVRALFAALLAAMFLHGVCLAAPVFSANAPQMLAVRAPNPPKRTPSKSPPPPPQRKMSGSQDDIMKAMKAMNDYQTRIQTVTKVVGKASQSIDQLTKLQ